MSEQELNEAANSMPRQPRTRDVFPVPNLAPGETQPSIEHLALLRSIAENNEKTDAEFLTVVDYAATSLYAALGTITAGKAS